MINKKILPCFFFERFTPYCLKYSVALELVLHGVLRAMLNPTNPKDLKKIDFEAFSEPYQERDMVEDSTVRRSVQGENLFN